MFKFLKKENTFLIECQWSRFGFTVMTIYICKTFDSEIFQSSENMKDDWLLLRRWYFFSFSDKEYGETISDKSDITYDLIWQSDAVRLSNQSTVYGFCVHPGSETSAALIFSDGKILHWELVETGVGIVTKPMKIYKIHSCRSIREK